jgi:hypothetical protein
MNELRQIVLLEAIRVTGNLIPYPIVDNWGHLQDEINELIELEFLELNENHYRISFEGKKILLLFKSERKEILDSCEIYRDVALGDHRADARFGLMTFKTRKLSDEEALPILKSFAYILNWEAYFENLRSINQAPTFVWQPHLFSSFEKLGNVNRHTWRYLGKNLQDAVLNCERLLMPIPKKDMIHITRE